MMHKRKKCLIEGEWIHQVCKIALKSVEEGSNQRNRSEWLAFKNFRLDGYKVNNAHQIFRLHKRWFSFLMYMALVGQNNSLNQSKWHQLLHSTLGILIRSHSKKSGIVRARIWPNKLYARSNVNSHLNKVRKCCTIPWPSILLLTSSPHSVLQLFPNLRAADSWKALLLRNGSLFIASSLRCCK